MVIPAKFDKKNAPKSINKRKGKRAGPEIVAILLLCFLVSLYVSFHQTSQMIEHHEKSITNQVVHADAPIRRIGTEPLAHEDLFRKTLKSCLPHENKNCKTFVPEDSVGERVALIAPPGDMTRLFFRLMQVVLGRAKKKKKIDMELIHTTHIAPYGYGKTQ
jgi:hypothetical protein